MQNKQTELSTFGRTLHELEEANRFVKIYLYFEKKLNSTIFFWGGGECRVKFICWILCITRVLYGYSVIIWLISRLQVTVSAMIFTKILRSKGAFMRSNSFDQSYSCSFRLLLCKHLIQHVWQHHQILDESLMGVYTIKLGLETGAQVKFEEKVWLCKSTLRLILSIENSLWRHKIRQKLYFRHFVKLTSANLKSFTKYIIDI